MLQWFVSSYVTDAALAEYMIQLNDVKETKYHMHAEMKIMLYCNN